MAQGQRHACSQELGYKEISGEFQFLLVRGNQIGLGGFIGISDGVHPSRPHLVQWGDGIDEKQR